MFKLNLIVRRKNDDIMIFSPAPWFRILFFLLAAIVLIGIITIAADGEGGSFLLPSIISAVCATAALYEESWTFNRKKRIIISKSGLKFLNKKKIVSFAEVENLELIKFLRGAESDGSADHEIDLSKVFSKENTAEATGNGPKIIHKRYHQELKLHLKNGNLLTLESLDSRGTETLEKKAKLISDFNGISLIK